MLFVETLESIYLFFPPSSWLSGHMSVQAIGVWLDRIHKRTSITAHQAATLHSLLGQIRITV